MPNYKLCNTYSFEKLDFESLKKKIDLQTSSRNLIKTNKPINIIPFGSGSTGNSFYIEIGEHKLLIDMGIGVKKIKNALEHHQKEINKVEAILLTHTHYDHRSAIKAICNNTDCKIYATNPSLNTLNSYDFKAETESLEYDRRQEILPGLYITAFKTDHDALGSCGYIVETEGYKLGYATDLGIIRKKTLELLAGSDVIILESNHDEKMLIEGNYEHFLKQRILSPHGHLSNRQSLEFQELLSSLGTKNFLLAHLSRENNRPEIVEKLVKDKHGDKINYYICPIEGSDLLTY